MNNTLVRKLDYFLGIPVCFILNIINQFLPFKKKDISNSKNVLFIELSEMGSTVLAYSAIKTLKQKLPKAKLHFLILEKNKESVQLLNIIDNKNILTIRDDSLLMFIYDFFKILKIFIDKKFDITFDLELFSRCSAILTFFTRATFKVGFHNFTGEGLYRGNLLTHNVYYNTHLHMVYNFYALTDSVFMENIKTPMLKQQSTKYQIYLPKVHYQSSLLKKYRTLFNNNNKILVVNPNAGNLLPIRAWSIENFAQVCNTAIKKMNLNVIIVGLPRSQKDGEYICNKVTQKNRIINFMGQTDNIFELLHILKTADIFLTNDSGPAHFAALTGIKNIVLFGPETPALYGPLSVESIPVYTKYLCSPCLTARNHRYTLCNENLCMKAITPKQIIEIIKQQIT